MKAAFSCLVLAGLALAAPAQARTEDSSALVSRDEGLAAEAVDAPAVELVDRSFDGDLAQKPLTASAIDAEEAADEDFEAFLEDLAVSQAKHDQRKDHVEPLEFDEYAPPPHHPPGPPPPGPPPRGPKPPPGRRPPGPPPPGRFPPGPPPPRGKRPPPPPGRGRRPPPPPPGEFPSPPEGDFPPPPPGHHGNFPPPPRPPGRGPPPPRPPFGRRPPPPHDARPARGPWRIIRWAFPAEERKPCRHSMHLHRDEDEGDESFERPHRHWHHREREEDAEERDLADEDADEERRPPFSGRRHRHHYLHDDDEEDDFSPSDEQDEARFSRRRGRKGRHARLHSFESDDESPEHPHRHSRHRHAHAHAHRHHKHSAAAHALFAAWHVAQLAAVVFALVKLGQWAGAKVKARRGGAVRLVEGEGEGVEACEVAQVGAMEKA
ncbi:hypothetical protein JCM10207_003254 [Rhodosporidiobolus poonsookiae]